MTVSADYQLGSDLRQRQPAVQASRQVLQSMVQDLVGSDQSLLAALLHLVSRPALLALEPVGSTVAVRMMTRDQLLRDLEDTYHPRVVRRLRDFLDGYLDLQQDSSAADPPTPSGLDQSSPTPIPQPGNSGREDPWFSAQPTAGGQVGTKSDHGSASVPASVPVTQFAPQSAPDTESNGRGKHTSGTTASSPSSPRASGTHHVSTDPASSTVASKTPLRSRAVEFGLIAAVAISALLLASRHPSLCRPLGLCQEATSSSTKPSVPSNQALQAGNKALAAMKAASELTSYEHDLGELDQQLLRLSGDPLSAEQIQEREHLKAGASEGHARVAEERRQAEVVNQATTRIDGLTKLPSEQVDKSRTEIRGTLEAIPSSSFSHETARQLLQRLDTTPQSTSPTPAPSSEPGPSQEPQRSPISGQQPSGGNGWRGSEGGGSSTRQAPAPPPPPSPQEDGSSNAPTRSEPLF